MKKTTLFVILASFSFMGIFAQTEEAAPEKDYDKWSIDIAAGLNNSSRPFSDISLQSGKFEDFTYNLGGRYMINHLFGFKAEVGFGEISNDLSSSPQNFTTNFTTANVQAVLNLGNLLNFREFTNRFNLLFHAGAGMTFFSFEDNALVDTDDSAHFIGGVTPQIKLSKSLALNLDLSVIGNLNQDYTLDGYGEVTNLDFDGMMVNATVGISLYLGDSDTHADWYDAKNDSKLVDKTKDLENRLAKLESELQDDDRDGVPNYLDLEPNTINGVAVNTKGQAVDKNQNQIPDELESSLNKYYLTKSEGDQIVNNAGLEMLKTLANSQTLSVYFDFDSTNPMDSSLEAMNSVLLYMRETPKATLTITGFADEIGNAEYNNNLAEKRAQAVKDILVDAGINESRMTVVSGGVDNSVKKSSSEARQLVRKVTFEIK
jgi:OOP family OmpA-OmpF porin